MPSKNISFSGSQGHALSAVLDFPPQSEKKVGAIFAHCFTCSKDIAAAREISRSLAQKGFWVLRFDFTGLGESKGDFSDSNFSSNVEDLLQAAEFMAKNYAQVELLVGHSLGGRAVLSAAAKLANVKSVATIGAPFEVSHIAHLIDGDSKETIAKEGKATVKIAGRAFTIKKQFLDDLTVQKSEECIKGLNKNILIMHSPEDQIVGIENAASIYQAARHPKSFISLSGADHLLSKKQDAEYAATIIAAWSSRNLTHHKHESSEEGEVIVSEIDSSSFKQKIISGTHVFFADEPQKMGGEDSAPTPYDLLLAGLGACTSMTVRIYARRKRINLKGVSVKLKHERNHVQDCDKNKWLEEIKRLITFEGELSENDISTLMYAAERCPVHKTLSSIVKITTKNNIANS